MHDILPVGEKIREKMVPVSGHCQVCEGGGECCTCSSCLDVVFIA